MQEQNTVPSLRRALKDVAMEKDAAVVARVIRFKHLILPPGLVYFGFNLPQFLLNLTCYCRRTFQHSFVS